MQLQITYILRRIMTDRLSVLDRNYSKLLTHTMTEETCPTQFTFQTSQQSV